MFEEQGGRPTHRGSAATPVWGSPTSPGPTITPASGPLCLGFLVCLRDCILLLPCQLCLREPLSIALDSLLAMIHEDEDEEEEGKKKGQN